MNKIIYAFKLARFQYLPIIIIPVFAGAFYAFGIYALAEWRFWICLIGASFAHLGANAANDYYDWKIGTDKIAWQKIPELRTEQVCGSNILANGKLTSKEAFYAVMAFFAVAFLCGTLIFVFVTKLVFWFGLFGFLIGYFYCAPPVAFGYFGRGLGEAAIFFAFGVLPISGTYYILGGANFWESVLASIPFGFIGALVLYHHHFSHVEVDRECGKNSPPVILGVERAKTLGRVLIAFTAFIIITLYRFGLYPPASIVSAVPLIVLALLPWKEGIVGDLSKMKQVVSLSLLSGLLLSISFLF